MVQADTSCAPGWTYCRMEPSLWHPPSAGHPGPLWGREGATRHKERWREEKEIEEEEKKRQPLIILRSLLVKMMPGDDSLFTVRRVNMQNAVNKHSRPSHASSHTVHTQTSTKHTHYINMGGTCLHHLLSVIVSDGEKLMTARQHRNRRGMLTG